MKPLAYRPHIIMLPWLCLLTWCTGSLAVSFHFTEPYFAQLTSRCHNTQVTQSRPDNPFANWYCRCAQFSSSPAYNHRGPGSVLQQYMRHLWWEEWHWVRIFSEYVCLHCQSPFHQYFIFIHISSRGWTIGLVQNEVALSKVFPYPRHKGVRGVELRIHSFLTSVL